MVITYHMSDYWSYGQRVKSCPCISSTETMGRHGYRLTKRESRQSLVITYKISDGQKMGISNLKNEQLKERPALL